MSIFNKISAAALVAIIGSSASADIVLRYSNWLPATHPFNSEVILPWIEDVARVTEGRVTIKMLPKVVGTVPTQFEVVRDGLADVSLIVDGYSPGRFKLGEISGMPFLGNDARSTSLAYWRIYEKYLKPFGEFEGTIAVATATTGPSGIGSRGDPITSVNDIRGLKLRIASVVGGQIIDALGGVAVNKPITEAYELMSTGVIDGMLTSPEPIGTFKLAESIPNYVQIDGGVTATAISFIVNEESFNDIPEADRQAIWSVSGEVFVRKIASVYHDLDVRGLKQLEEAGATITTASPEFVAELHTRLQSVEDAWIATATGIGLKNAADVLAEFRAEVKKIEADLGIE